MVNLPSEEKSRQLAECEEKLVAIHALLKKIALEVVNPSLYYQYVLAWLQTYVIYRHARAFSPGLQEYFEALGVLQYLSNGTCLTKTDVMRIWTDADVNVCQIFWIFL